MLESKLQLDEMAKDMKIEIRGLENMPEFGVCPTIVQIAPGKTIRVPGRYYTMGTMDNITWTPIKEVSEQYKLVQHYEAVGALLQGLAGREAVFGKPSISLRFSPNGARMFNDVKFANSSMTVNGDIIVPVLRQENSVDLSRRFLSQFRAERQVCTNGMTVPDGRFPNKETVKKLHRIGTLDLEETLNITMENMGSFSTAIQLWDGWKNKKVTTLQLVNVMEEIGISEDQAESVLQSPLRGFKGTLQNTIKDGKTDLWTAYNSVTQWITDNTTNPATESERSSKASEAFELLSLA